jgi:hypothetical protein
MKRILLRTVADGTFPPGSPEYTSNLIVYADVIRQVIRRPLDQQKGADMEEMRKGIRVLDAVDKADQVLVLEDADWEHLKAKTLAMPWAIIDRRLLDFCEAVIDATDTLTLNDELPAYNGQVREPAEV